MKYTEKDIQILLATRPSSPFFFRKNIAVVSNVSWSMLEWECDLLVCTKSKYLIEIEIKSTFADWKNDFHKGKHDREKYPKTQEMIKQFYYAAPQKLAYRHHELTLPIGAGVISVDDDSGIVILKPAWPRVGNRKLTDYEVIKLLHASSIRGWNYLKNQVSNEKTEESAKS